MVNLWRALKPLLAIASWAAIGVAAASELTQIQVVGDTRVSLAVVPEGRGAHDAAARWPPSYRIVVGLADRRSGRPVPDAVVSANIVEKGLAGEERRLEPREREGRAVYEAAVDLPRQRAIYRVLVHFRRPGSKQTGEAEFQYEHHH